MVATELNKLEEFRAFVFCMSEAVDDEAEVGELNGVAFVWFRRSRSCVAL